VARWSVYKSLFLCLIVGVCCSGFVFATYEHLPAWLTNDAVLQQLIQDSLPLVGIGNLALTLGSISWTLVGSQGRYRLATTNVLLGSWLVTLPLAAVFSISLNFSLDAQVAAVVVGYMVSGTLNSAALLRSDWKEISKDVMAECQE